MGIVDFIGVFFKRVILFCVGFVIAMPLTGLIGAVGLQLDQNNKNPILGLIVLAAMLFTLILGIGIMYYAATLKQP